MADARQWMPLHIGSYLKNTQRLTTEQHGAYLLLIMDYWNAQEPLPDDDDALAAITRMSVEGWKKARPAIERFFKVSASQWRHERIEAEMKAAKKNVADKADRMRRAREAKKAKANSITASIKGSIIGPVIDLATGSIIEPETGPITGSSTALPLPSPLPNLKVTKNPSKSASDDAVLFDAFWLSYPHPNNRGSKAKARERFFKLSKPDRAAVFESLGPYADYCDAAKDWYSPKMAEGYLNPAKKIWENTPDAKSERARQDRRNGDTARKVDSLRDLHNQAKDFDRAGTGPVFDRDGEPPRRAIGAK